MSTDQPLAPLENGSAEQQGVEVASSQTREPGWNWNEHIPLILTVASSVFVALRLLSVSAFEIQTANAILQNIGTTGVIVGTVTAIVGPMIPIAAVTVVVFAGDQLKSAPKYAIFAATVVIFIAVVFVSPVIFLLFALVALPVAILNLFGRIPVNPIHVRSAVIIATAVLLVAVSLGTDPWLPSERLGFVGTAKPLIGYVLSTDDRSIAVLENKPREVEYFKIEDLKSRSLCSLTASASSLLANPLTLPDLFFGVERAHYPPCSTQNHSP